LVLGALLAAAVGLIWLRGDQPTDAHSDRLAAPKATERPQRPQVADVKPAPAGLRSTAAEPAPAETKTPRSLSSQQRAGIAEQLRSVPPIPLDVAAIADDQEAMAFAQQIKEVLDSCGWRVAAPRWTTTALNKPGTIGLLINALEDTPPQIILLHATLKSVGINAEAIIDPAVPPGNVRLVVGRQE
jgi:hypothetical protein